MRMTAIPIPLNAQSLNFGFVFMASDDVAIVNDEGEGEVELIVDWRRIADGLCEPAALSFSNSKVFDYFSMLEAAR